MVNGVAAVKVEVPAGLDSDGVVPVSVAVGGAESQDGVTLHVGDGGNWTASTDAVEATYQQLRNTIEPPFVAEVPHDRIGLPNEWLGLLSWNINAAAGPEDDPRTQMLRTAMGAIYSGTFDLLAAQGVPGNLQAGSLQRLLPGGAGQWGRVFYDTTSGLDNGIWHRSNLVKLTGGFALDVLQTESGRLLHDANRAVYPPVVGHYQAGDFDFTLVSLHLFSANGKTDRVAGELTRVLDYLDWYFNQSGHDPDVLLCGDFGLPSALSGETVDGQTLDGLLEADARFGEGERRFVVLGHEPTERYTDGRAYLNADHCLCSVDALEELVQVRRVSPTLLTDNPADPAERLTSNHFPVAAFFRTAGEGVELDGSKLILLP
jgi:hypothetical protein